MSKYKVIIEDSAQADVQDSYEILECLSLGD